MGQSDHIPSQQQQQQEQQQQQQPSQPSHSLPPGVVPIISTTFSARVPLEMTVDGYKNAGYLPSYLNKGTGPPPAPKPALRRSMSAAMLREKEKPSWARKALTSLKENFGKKKVEELKGERKPVPIPPVQSSFYPDLPWKSLYSENNEFRDQYRAQIEQEEEEEARRAAEGGGMKVELPPRALTPYRLDRFRPENRASTPGGRPAYRYVRREEGVGADAASSVAATGGLSPVDGRETEEVLDERKKARRALEGEEEL